MSDEASFSSKRLCATDTAGNPAVAAAAAAPSLESSAPEESERETKRKQPSLSSLWPGSSSSSSSTLSSSSPSKSSTLSYDPNRVLASNLKVKPAAESTWLNSRANHGRCLYFPGAYSSHGQMQRRQQQCPQIYCCRCQHPYQPTSPLSGSTVSTLSKPPGTSQSEPGTGLQQRSLKNPESLLEISARFVAEHMPYEYIEQQYHCIPEPVQRRIIFWSFPRDESYIRLYSSISSIFKQEPSGSSSSSSNYLQPSTSSSGASGNSSTVSTIDQSIGGSHVNFSSLFNCGLNLLRSGAVHQVMQIGFNLTGVVSNPTSLSSSTSSFFSTAQGSSLVIEAGAVLLPKWFLPEMPTRGPGGISSPYLTADPVPLYRRNNSYLVSITFDRCKITSATCTCTARDHHLFWCEHVVALALYRIQKPLSVDLRVPISETLLELDRQQLQKLVQYLIAEHHVQILPTVQRLADDLSHKNSAINMIDGAPDPTSGACVYGPHDWYLNEEKIASQVRDLVKFVSIPESKQIILLFYKVIEMLKIKDSNGPRFLRIITEQFLYSYSHYHKPSDSFESLDPFIYLWDHLTNLWIFIVADPNMFPLKRVQWREMFRHWSHVPNCPREDSYFNLNVDTGTDTRYTPPVEMHQHRSNYYGDQELNDHSKRRSRSNSHSSGGYSSSSRPRRRRILERALDATYLTWDDSHLQLILRQDGPVERNSCLYFSDYFDREGFPIWSEHLPTACVRIASLRVNGRNQEALRLAMAVVRYFRHCQYKHQKILKTMFEVAPASHSWIGNPIDPIGILFDTLAEASLTNESRLLDSYYALVGYDKKIENLINKPILPDLFMMYNETNQQVERDNIEGGIASAESNDKPRYRHVRVPGSVHGWDTYLTAAVYVAIVGLSQHRRSPDLDSQRDKTYRQEERMIRKLLDIRLDSTLISVVRQQARFLVEYGLLSDMVTLDHRTKNVPFDIVQIPGLVRYLFGALLLSEPNLAYDIGLRSLRFFAFNEELRGEMDQVLLRSTFGIYLEIQLMLAKTMFFAARNDYNRLQVILQTLQRYVTNPQYLNRLAQDIFHFSASGPRHENLMRIAYTFGLHLAKITLYNSNCEATRKSIIQLLVNCATEIGCDNVVHIMSSWHEYFNPVEAVKNVASVVLTTTSHTRICNHLMRYDELSRVARKLAVECTLKDPSGCALYAFPLCEKDPTAFDTIVQVVEKAASLAQIIPPRLFQIVRYLETHGVSERACKIALMAANQVVIPLNADSHQSINDLQFACHLAQKLGTAELTELVNILIKNVKCAPVLADMIRRLLHHQSSVVHKPTMMMHNGYRSSMMHDSHSINFMEHLTIDDRTHRRYKTISLDQPPLSNLLYAAVKAYIETVMRRLEHISPRHYSDFIEFLTRAQETILLAPDGKNDFSKLLEKIKSLYKGKKKLMCLVKERFRC